MFTTVIESHEEIKRNKQDVFNYVTTPINWPTWHPLTTKVKGKIFCTPIQGEKFVETIHTPILRRQVFLGACFHWTIVETKNPDTFTFEVKGPSKSHIIYRFEESQKVIEGKPQIITTWHRELRYTPKNLLMGILNKLWFERVLRDASEEALRNVKRILNTDS